MKQKEDNGSVQYNFNCPGQPVGGRNVEMSSTFSNWTARESLTTAAYTPLLGYAFSDTLTITPCV
jgi:hypothetical protein